MVAIRQEVDFPRIKRVKAMPVRKDSSPFALDQLKPLAVPTRKERLDALATRQFKAAHPAVERVLRRAVEQRLIDPIQTSPVRSPPDWKKVLDRLYYHGLFSRVVRAAPAEPSPAPAEVKRRLSLAISRIDTSRLHRLLALRKSLSHADGAVSDEKRSRAQRLAASLRMLIEGKESTFT
jgi:hypothetical protein